MSHKRALPVFALLIGATCLAEPEHPNSKDAQQARTPASQQFSNSKQRIQAPAPAIAGSHQDQPSANRKPVNMAEYCKEHTC